MAPGDEGAAGADKIATQKYTACMQILTLSHHKSHSVRFSEYEACK